LLAIAAVKMQWRFATALVWLFSLVSVIDLVYSTARAVGSQMYTFYMGWSWYIVNFYVPMLIVSQVMIIYYLLSRREEQVRSPESRGIAAGSKSIQS